MKKTAVLLLGLSLIMALHTPSNRAASQSQVTNEEQITAYLNAHPLLVESGAQVLGVTFLGEALVIDLSADILPDGTYEEAVFTQLQADLDASFHINQFFMTTFKVEGQMLEDWGRPLPAFEVQADPPAVRELPGDGPLTGVRVALSPGHGLYWSETWSAWLYQRAEWYGIREDTLNAEIMRYTQAALLNQGATVVQLRELDLSARTGVTGYPAWHEGARQYAIAGELPSWVWDGSNNNYNSDIRARPYMANYYGADILISLHNNGWDGTLTGTETYWDTDNHPDSQALANAVHNRIIDTIRTAYDPDWHTRGVKPSDSAYGEINYAQMPAILIELAFMDRQYPDNAYLHDEAFKILAASAITQGICDFLGMTCEEPTVELPVTMEESALTPPYGSGMCDSGWVRYPNQRGRYAYLALNTTEESQSTNRAVWTPDLPVSGEYRLEAFIPDHDPINWTCPEKTINNDTTQAVYQIQHANGISSRLVNQASVSNQWVDLGIFHFNDSTQPAVTLTDVTRENTWTTTVSASALRFTLVGNAGTQFYDLAWLAESWLAEDRDAPAEHIRNFMTFYHSCLDAPILDTDGVEIDIPTLIQQAASTHQISPKALLAIMEAKQQALSWCPDNAALGSLMGLAPAGTAGDQITAAAQLLRDALDTLAATGTTPNGWTPGIPKVTQDGVSVIPANDAIAILFDVTQNAGGVWGGTSLDEPGVQGVYAAWRDYNLDHTLPAELFYAFVPAFRR